MMRVGRPRESRTIAAQGKEGPRRLKHQAAIMMAKTRMLRALEERAWLRAVLLRLVSMVSGHFSIRRRGDVFEVQ